MIIIIMATYVAHRSAKLALMTLTITTFYPGLYWYSSNTHNYLAHHLNSPGSILAKWQPLEGAQAN